MLRGLGVRSAFDFRGKDERSEALCGVEDIAMHSLPVEPTVVAALRAISPPARRCRRDRRAGGDAGFLSRLCRHNTPRFRALFAHLLEDRAPLVIHCTAGKDRTGFACALILHALGVPDDVIAEDYLLTNRFYRRDPSASSDLPDDVRQVLGTVKPRSWPPRSRPSTPTMAISKTISSEGLASAPPSAPN